MTFVNNKFLLPTITMLAVLMSESVDCGSVFMYLPVAAKSHKNVWLPLAKSLAKKNHTVTIVTTFPEPEPIPNYEEIIIDHHQDWSQQISRAVTNPKSGALQRFFDSISILYMFVSQVGDVHKKVLDHPTIKQLLNNSSKYDVSFVSPLFNEMGLFLAHEFDSPVILYMATVSSSLLSASMGHFDHPILAAQAMSIDGSQSIPNFWNRFSYFLESIFHEQIKVLTSWSQVQLWKSHFPESDPPKLVDLERNASFGMYFSHVLFDAVRPTMPNTIDVGTIHCRTPNQLPEDLENLISDSELAADNGIIMVSFGSWLLPEHMPSAITQAIIDTLNQLPYLVFIKWSGPTNNLGKNIVSRQWLPQQDLLGHKATKLFITQGGMMSVQESLYHGVPMVVIPLFGDQLANGARIERQGTGKVLPIEEITSSKLKSVIIELVSNSSFEKNAKKLGDLIRDDFHSPLDRAVFWTEYVMRHRGAKHLQSPMRHSSLIHFYSVDLILFTLFISCLLTYFLTVSFCKASRTFVNRIIK